MARSNPRLVAGVGIVSVVLLLGGSGAALAVADSDGGHSDRGNGSHSNSSDGKGDYNGQSRGNSRGDSGDDDNSGSVGNGNSASHRADDSTKVNNDFNDTAAPKVRVGSGRDDQEWISPGGSVTGNESGAAGGTGPSEAPGSDRHAGTIDGGFASPRVTFGNGRTPGGDIDGPEPHWRAPVSQPEPEPGPPPPPPPAPAPPPSWVDRIATHPAPTQQLGVAPAADLADPLWGVAGLLLIPAAGAALGYRQARATQAVERLRRS